MQINQISRVLVLGCSGVVGHGVAANLVDNNFFVVGTTFKKHASSNSKNFVNVKNINFCQKNFIKKIDKLITKYKIQAVINCAAIVPNALSAYSTLQINKANYSSVIKILRNCIKNKLIFFINMSGFSFLEKSKKKNLPRVMRDYFISKKKIEQRLFVKKKKINIVSLKILAPYGHILEKNSVIPKFISLVKNGENLNIPANGERKQIFTFSEDIGAACAYILKNKLTGKIPFAGPIIITTKTLAKNIISIYSKKKINIFFNKQLKDKDGDGLKNFLLEENNKKNKNKILIKKHDFKESLIKILNQKTSIKVIKA
jgi:nucleoside-diphosphate-sugar epimerase